MKKFIIRAFVKNNGELVSHLDTDNEIIIRDLKTFRGVLNRVKSASFPNTISGVIYQSNAFTAVSDGQINLAPDSTSIRAAKDAMNGWDPSYGSLYYYNPVKTTSKWILSRRTVITIGNHVFAV